MAQTNDVKIVLTAENKTEAAIGKAESSLSRFSSSLKSLGIIAGGAFATKKILDFGIASVKAYSDAEAAQARFEHSLKTIAKASDLEVEALKRQQEALMKVTRFDDDAIASAQGFLATFQLNTKQIESLTPKLLDMAEGLRTVEGGTIGLEQASNMLGKAIQLGTVDNLKRVGVTIPGTTKAMQDLWSANFELASVQERVLMIGQLVDGNFKGQATSAGQTLAGQLDILKNTFANLQEQIGGTLAESLAPFIAQLTTFAQDPQFIEAVMALTKAIAFGLAIALNGVVGTVTFFYLGLKQLWDWAKLVGSYFANKFALEIQIAKVAIDLITSAVKTLVSFLEKAIALASQIGSAVGGGISKVAGKVSGKRADGGSVTSGQTYLVGERGPELFTPNFAGLITPNHQLAGGAVINITVTGNQLLSESAGEIITRQIMQTLKNNLRI